MFVAPRDTHGARTFTTTYDETTYLPLIMTLHRCWFASM